MLWVESRPDGGDGGARVLVVTPPTAPFLFPSTSLDTFSARGVHATIIHLHRNPGTYNYTDGRKHRACISKFHECRPLPSSRVVREQ